MHCRRRLRTASWLQKAGSYRTSRCAITQCAAVIRTHSGHRHKTHGRLRMVQRLTVVHPCTAPARLEPQQYLVHRPARDSPAASSASGQPLPPQKYPRPVTPPDAPHSIWCAREGSGPKPLGYGALDDCPSVQKRTNAIFLKKIKVVK